MASNACLVSSYSQELKDLTQGKVDLPMFSTPFEAREICRKLLDNPSLRQDIVQASQAFVDQNCRWRYRFKEMEQILGVKLVQDGKVGIFRKLQPEIPREYQSATNVIPIKHNESKIETLNWGRVVSIPSKPSKNWKKANIKNKINNITIHYMDLYKKYSDEALALPFWKGYFLLFCVVLVLSILTNNHMLNPVLGNHASQMIYLTSSLLFYMLILATVVLILALLYRPFRKCLYILKKLLKKIYERVP